MRAWISTGIYIDIDDPPQASLNDVNPESVFGTIELVDQPGGRVYIAVRSRAEAEALIQAAMDVRDLLPEGSAS